MADNTRQDRVRASESTPSADADRDNAAGRQSRWLIWRSAWRVAWTLRFVYLQAAVLITVFVVLRPLQGAALLPHPSLPPYAPEPPDQQEALVAGPTTYVHGTQGATRVLVYDPRSGQPIPKAQLNVAFTSRDPSDVGQSSQAAGHVAGYRPTQGNVSPTESRPSDGLYPLFKGETGNQGTANVVFEVPRDVEGTSYLLVDIVGPIGSQRIVRPIEIRRDTTALDLDTDKSKYRPGEIIHARLLASETHTGIPVAGRPVTLTVFDARNNIVCADAGTTSTHGTASAECELAARVNLGRYRVEATAEGTDLVREVEVAAGAQPSLDVRVQTEETYYLYGQQVRAVVHVTDRWGSAVSDAQVEVLGSTDAPETQDVQLVRGETDETGSFAFAFALADVLPQDPGTRPDWSAVRIVARAIGAGGETGAYEIAIPAAEQPLLIEILPQGNTLAAGPLKPGIENVIPLTVLYPDGKPAECTLAVETPGFERTVGTERPGMAAVRYQPDAGESVTFTISARDSSGHEGRKHLVLPVEGGEDHVLLWPERSVYRAGETMHMAVIAPRAVYAIYLDVLKGGQMVATYAAPVRGGKASFDVDLGKGLAGVLVLDAYYVRPDGVPVRDRRTVVVDPPDELQVSVSVDQAQDTPATVSQVTLHVRDAQGGGRRSAVDVGVLSGAQDTPTVANSVPRPEEGQLALGDYLRHVRVGRTSLSPGEDSSVVRAERVSRLRPVPEEVKREFEAVATARAERRRAFSSLSTEMIQALAILTAGLWIVVAIDAWRERKARPVLRSIVCGLLGGLVLLPFAAGTGLLLGHLAQKFFGPGAVLVLGMAWFGALLALFVYGWARPDGWTQLIWALVIGELALVIGLRYAMSQGAEIDLRWTGLGLAALAAMWLGLWAHVLVLGSRNEWGGMVSVIALLLLLPMTLVGISAVGGSKEMDLSLVQGLPSGAAIDGGARASGEGGRTEPAEVFFLTGPTSSHKPESALLQWILPSEERLPVFWWVLGGMTDLQGQMTFEIPAAEPEYGSELVVAASTERGERGTGQATLGAPRPFAIQPDLPGSLTVGDRLDLPIAIHNAFPVSQTVSVTATEASWFRLGTHGMAAPQVEVAPRQVGTLHLPIQVVEPGQHSLDLVARSEQGESLVSRPVEVAVDGLHVVGVYTGRAGNTHEDGPDVLLKVRIPWGARPGTDQLIVKLYPNWASLVAEGLNGVHSLDRLANHSFDHLVARIRTMVLRHAYLSDIGDFSAMERAELERFAALAYQELLTFEAADGGFSTFGNLRAGVYETAQGLVALSEIDGFYPVDSALTNRTARWLMQRQSADGTWWSEQMPPSWENLPRPELPLTAYVAWALIESGYASSTEVLSATGYVGRYQDKAQDPYALALVANALDASAEQGAERDAALARLAEIAELEEGRAVWRTGIETLSGAVGDSGRNRDVWLSSADVETTALATHALVRAGTDPGLAALGLATLAEERDANGTWGSPQATYLALRALLAAVQEGYSLPVASGVRVTVDDTATEAVTLAPTDPKEARVLVFDELSKGYNDVELEVAAEAEATYQVLATYDLPWNQVEPTDPEKEPVALELSYDRTSMEVGETITATAVVSSNQARVLRLAILDLGLPPGLDVFTEDLDAWIKQGSVTHYELGEGRIVVYLAELSAEEPVRLSYRLQARYPLSVKTQLSFAYDPANPRYPAVHEPTGIEVLSLEEE